MDSKLWDSRDKDGKPLKDADGNQLKDLVEKWRMVIEFDVPGQMLPESVIVEWSAQWEGGKKGACPQLKADRGALVAVFPSSYKKGKEGQTIAVAAHCVVIPDEPVKTVKLSSSAKP